MLHTDEYIDVVIFENMIIVVVIVAVITDRLQSVNKVTKSFCSHRCLERKSEKRTRQELVGTHLMENKSSLFFFINEFSHRQRGSFGYAELKEWFICTEVDVLTKNNVDMIFDRFRTRKRQAA